MTARKRKERFNLDPAYIACDSFAPAISKEIWNSKYRYYDGIGEEDLYEMTVEDILIRCC